MQLYSFLSLVVLVPPVIGVLFWGFDESSSKVCATITVMFKELENHNLSFHIVHRRHCQQLKFLEPCGSNRIYSHWGQSLFLFSVIWVIWPLIDGTHQNT